MAAGLSAGAFADATTATGVIATCVKNDYNESITVRTQVTTAKKMTDRMSFNAKIIEIAPSDSKCVVLSEFNSWAWQAWDQDVNANVNFSQLDKNGHVLKSDSMVVHPYVWTKHLIIDDKDQNPTAYPQFAMTHYDLHGATFGYLDNKSNVAGLEESLRYTYKSYTSFEYWCNDAWNYNCGVATLWWVPTKQG